MKRFIHLTTLCLSLIVFSSFSIEASDEFAKSIGQSGTFIKRIEREDLTECNPIRILCNKDGNPLARVDTNRGVTGLVCCLCDKFGLRDHLAPRFSPPGSEEVYEKFIRLFETKSEEETAKGEIPDLLKTVRGSNGDLSLQRLTAYCQTQKDGKIYSAAFDTIHPDSLDDLYLTHMLLGLSDSTSRNFLYQYINGALHLKRIDYGDNLLSNSVSPFLGEKMKADQIPFGEKGKKVIANLSLVNLDDIPWKDYAAVFHEGRLEKAEYNLKERIRILDRMHKNHFFDTGTHKETMTALYYIGLRWSIDQRIALEDTFADFYWCTYAFDHVSPLENPMCSLGNLLSFLKHTLNQNESVESPQKLKAIDDRFIDNVLKDWKRHPNKLKLPYLERLRGPDREKFLHDLLKPCESVWKIGHEVITKTVSEFNEDQRDSLFRKTANTTSTKQEWKYLVEKVTSAPELKTHFEIEYPSKPSKILKILDSVEDPILAEDILGMRIEILSTGSVWGLNYKKACGKDLQALYETAEEVGITKVAILKAADDSVLLSELAKGLIKGADDSPDLERLIRHQAIAFTIAANAAMRERRISINKDDEINTVLNAQVSAIKPGMSVSKQRIQGILDDIDQRM